MGDTTDSKGRAVTQFEQFRLQIEECPVVVGATITIDKDSRERAEQLLKEAFGILVRGTKITRIVQLNCLSCRAGTAIRHIVELLAEQAEAYRLDTDLRSALDLISQGQENELTDFDREIWDEMLEQSHAKPWVTEQ
jgi:type II secretory pathway component PulF